MFDIHTSHLISALDYNPKCPLCTLNAKASIGSFFLTHEDCWSWKLVSGHLKLDYFVIYSIFCLTRNPCVFGAN